MDLSHQGATGGLFTMNGGVADVDWYLPEEAIKRYDTGW